VGFECRFSYHDKVDGEYNREEVKTFSRKIGDPLEDVSLEKLAAAIMGQYARRDIFIVDVEVFEISKKQLSFKETKGGVVIKNKKFLFDHSGDATVVTVQEMQEQPLQLSGPSQSMPQSLSAASTPSHPHANLAQRHRRPVDYVVFAPEPQQLFEAKRKGLKFTENRKYPVFQKTMSPTGIGEIYVLEDDAGREQTVSDVYFVPGNVNLVADRELGFSESPQDRDGGRLLYNNASVDPGMPDLRGRR